MLIGIMCALSLMAFDCSRAEAAYVYESVEPWAYFYPQKIRCTCYCEHRGTATLSRPYFGIAAGQKDWLGYVAEVNRVNEYGDYVYIKLIKAKG